MGLTGLEKSLRQRKNLIVNRLITIATKVDLKGQIYCEVIERNLDRLLKLGIDMKPFFQSSLPFRKIEEHYYPQYHERDDSVIVPSTFSTTKDVLGSYSIVMAEMEKDSHLQMINKIINPSQAKKYSAMKSFRSEHMGFEEFDEEEHDD